MQTTQNKHCHVCPHIRLTPCSSRYIGLVGFIKHHCTKSARSADKMIAVSGHMLVSYASCVFINNTTEKAKLAVVVEQSRHYEHCRVSLFASFLHIAD